MTTTLETYRAALEHIRDGSDAVCIQCGWMGEEDETFAVSPDGRCLTMWACPVCGGKIEIGADEIAAYALAQGEKG